MNVGEQFCAKDRACLADRIRRSRGATQWKKPTRSGAVAPGALLYLALSVLFVAGCGDEYELPFDVEPLLQFLGLEDLPPANEGAFEGGPTGTSEDAALANALADEDDRRPDGEAVFNMPTNGPPSPLFGAEPFRQQMLRFEEFGRERFHKKNPKNKGKEFL